MIISIVILSILVPAAALISSSADNLGSTRSLTKYDRNYWLVVDFDGTCTENDTTGILQKIASSFSKEKDEDRQKRQETWNQLEQEYFKEYEKVKQTILGTITSSNEEKYTLDDALDALDAVSTSVTHKVSSTKVLSGLPTSTADMQQMLDHNLEYKNGVKLQKGCIKALSKAIAKGWKFGVLSINWSPQLIDAALLQPLREDFYESDLFTTEEEELNKKSLLPLHEILWSNKIDSDGRIELVVPGAIEKRERLRMLRPLEKYTSDNHILIYIGDSATDLLGLLEADIGILVGQSSTINSFAKHWGIRLAPLSELSQSSYIKNSDKMLKTIWTTDDWNEIDLALHSAINMYEPKSQSLEL